MAENGGIALTLVILPIILGVAMKTRRTKPTDIARQNKKLFMEHFPSVLETLLMQRNKTWKKTITKNNLRQLLFLSVD
jgi:hypothetical protein